MVDGGVLSTVSVSMAGLPVRRGSQTHTVEMAMRTVTVWGLVALMAMSVTAFGQEDGEQPPEGDRPERERQQQRQRGDRDGERPDPREPGRRGFRPGGSPLLMRALDTDRDGE